MIPVGSAWWYITWIQCLAFRKLSHANIQCCFRCSRYTLCAGSRGVAESWHPILYWKIWNFHVWNWWKRANYVLVSLFFWGTLAGWHPSKCLEHSTGCIVNTCTIPGRIFKKSSVLTIVRFQIWKHFEYSALASRIL